MPNKLLFALVLGIAATLGTARAQTDQPASQPATARVEGRIILVRVIGTVTAHNTTTGSDQVLKAGDQISQHYTVTSAASGSALLLFSNGATVEIGSDSSLNIDTFEQDPFSDAIKPSEMKHEIGTSKTRLSLVRGELVGKVVHLNVDHGTEFTVATPIGAAGIRGTSFKITFRPSKDGKSFIFSIKTADGIVEFKVPASLPVPIAGGKQVVLSGSVTEPSAGSASPTITLSSTPSLSNLPAGDAAAITAAIQSIAVAIADVVVPPSGSNPNPKPPPSNPPATPPSTEPPPVTPPSTDTTPTAGSSS